MLRKFQTHECGAHAYPMRGMHIGTSTEKIILFPWINTIAEATELLDFPIVVQQHFSTLFSKATSKSNIAYQYCRVIK